MAQKGINRRHFLGAAAATTAFTVIPRHVLGGEDYTAANDKLNVAGIGVGGMGFNNLRQLKSENIVALCDVDHQYAAKAFKEFPDVKRYKDYRIMLEK